MTPSEDVAQTEWDIGDAEPIEPGHVVWGSVRVRHEYLTKPEYLTKAQAGEIVQLHPKTIERAIQAGELPAYKLRGKVRIRRRDLEAWVEANAVEPVSDLHDI